MNTKISIAKRSGSPFLALAREQIVDRLREALSGASQDLGGNADRIQRILSDVVDRIDAYQLVGAPPQRHSVAV